MSDENKLYKVWDNNAEYIVNDGQYKSVKALLK